MNTQSLKWALNLPLKESIMFMNGDKYLTGSDYPQELLNQTLEDCPHCDRTGTMYVPNYDDVNAEICDCIYGQIQEYNAGLKAVFI